MQDPHLCRESTSVNPFIFTAYMFSWGDREGSEGRNVGLWYGALRYTCHSSADTLKIWNGKGLSLLELPDFKGLMKPNKT